MATLEDAEEGAGEGDEGLFEEGAEEGAEDLTEEDLEHTAALEEFIGRWSLRADSVDLLVTLDPEVQAKVIQEFAPRDESRDVNFIFLKFAAGVAENVPRSGVGQGGGKGGGKGGAVRLADALSAELSPEAEQFAVQWSLGAEAVAVLANLEPDVQQKVMEEFAPRDASRDANYIFIKFAQNASTGKGKGKGKDKGKQGKAAVFVPPRSSWSPAPRCEAEQGKAAVLVPPRSSWVPAPSTPPRLLIPQKIPPKMNSAPKPPGLNVTALAAEDPQEFIEMWKLDEESQELLEALEPDQQAKVMQEFSPRDTSRDVNRIFVKFASGIAEMRQRGGPVAVLNGYVAKWNLNEDAQQVLLSLQPEAQERVMATFNPRDVSRDVSNIFMKFAQSIDRSAGGYSAKGWGKGGKGKSVGRSWPY